MIERNITKRLLDALKDTPVVFLSGARQTGKSTLAEHIAKIKFHIPYYTLDDLTVMAAAKNDPQGFVQGLPERVIIDEAQRVPELLLPIKAEVDRNRKPGRFFLTGSANVMFLPKVSELLAGRMEIISLWPFSQGELQGTKEQFIHTLFSPKLKFPAINALSENQLWNTLITGGYPESVKRSRPQRRDVWFGSYATAIIQRDIQDLSNIDGLVHIPNLLQLIAGRCAEILNLANLSRALQIPQTSLKRYLSLCESTYLIHRIPPWHGNINARIVKSPKIFLTDTGLLCHLLGINAERFNADRALAGHILENFVLNELKKQISWSDISPGLYHFRSHAGREVDAVLEDRRGRCVGIEIKLHSNISPMASNNLMFFKERLKKKFHRGIILYRGKNIVPLAEDIHAIPLEYLWS